MLERVGLPITFVLLWSSAFWGKIRRRLCHAICISSGAVCHVAAIFASVGAGVHIWNKA